MFKVVKTDHFEIMFETFDSVSELLHTNDSRKSNFGYNRKVESGGWAGVKNYNEAVDLYVHGFEKPLERIKANLQQIDSKKTINKKIPRFENGVEGFMPVVPNALMGLPNSMLKFRYNSKKSKILNIMIDSTFSASTGTEEVIDYYSKVFAYIVDLEKNGFRCRIETLISLSEEGTKKCHVLKVLTKDESQPIDMKRSTFPIMHPAMLRVFGFDWYERLPGAQHIGGYGRAFHHWSDEKKVKEVLDAVAQIDNYYYIYYGSDYKKVFEKVK